MATFESSDQEQVYSQGQSLSSGQMPTAFTCFPDLPIELRLRIWTWACFHPRDVHVGVKTVRTITPWTNPSPIGLVDYRYYFSRTSCPLILRTTRESRSEALKRYQLDFGIHTSIERLTCSIPPRIYVNWEADRICIDDDFALYGAEALRDLLLDRKVRSLALTVRDKKTPLLLPPLLRAEHLQDIFLVWDTRRFCPDGDYRSVRNRESYRGNGWEAIRTLLISKWPSMELPSSDFFWHQGDTSGGLQYTEEGSNVTLMLNWPNDRKLPLRQLMPRPE
ncbi:uncharacterized protein LY89DRAFT_681048 [Mollisia scopiformis]|uniref:2EXR domain-containing protein n=1 Tax=Mollisia scopiformis TaxID=149040 RepID=A0A194XNB0_MOLSC|nr:uncharacterized protein LY89DRAFT_681048 [Mollisia scopiformis]KUJ21584.1 hypothetical protein LY89DRAFT_681048 [Mollisia scopiformis]